jgi:hypothetical protein
MDGSAHYVSTSRVTPLLAQIRASRITHHAASRARTPSPHSNLEDAAKAAGITGEARRAYMASLRADQNAKLSSFSTRPAIYLPAFNFVSERAADEIL